MLGNRQSHTAKRANARIHIFHSDITHYIIKCVKLLAEQITIIIYYFFQGSFFLSSGILVMQLVDF